MNLSYKYSFYFFFFFKLIFLYMEVIYKIGNYIKSVYYSSTDNEFKKPDGYKNINSNTFKK